MSGVDIWHSATLGAIIGLLIGVLVRLQEIKEVLEALQ